MPELPSEIARKYRAVKVLGEGGFGTVYHAVQLDLDRPVALKILSDKSLSDKDAVARFIHEAHVASRIDHPNVVSLLDFGVDGTVGYIAFPLVEGCTLRDKIRLGPVAVGPAMLIAIGLADALAEIHRQGVIHRDMKPENVLLAAGDKPMLTDFGISKSAESSVQTREGIIFGTPGYVAPEQLLQEKASALSDQFSLGVIVFEVLTGRRPYTGDSPAEEAMARVKTPPANIRVLLPRLDAGVAEVIMKMLARRPQDRYTDMRAVHRALQLATQRLSAADREGISRLDGASRATSVPRGLASAVQPAVQPSPGPSTGHDTPVLKGALRSRISQTVPLRSGVQPGPGVAPWWRRSKPLLAAAVGVLLFAGLFWATRPRSGPLPAEVSLVGPGPPVGPVAAALTPDTTEPAQVPSEVPLPESFPRIPFPDCDKLGAAGGAIPRAALARCDVVRWLASWEKMCGRRVSGNFAAAVRLRKGPGAVLPMLELFESAAAAKATSSLAWLRDSAELDRRERADAGLLLLQTFTGHVVWAWRGFGAALGQTGKFTGPKLFQPDLTGFYPNWERQWELVRKSDWPDQAATLGEWVAFHRALDEQRIDWTPDAPRHDPLRDAVDGKLAELDVGVALTRLWRLRLAGQERVALPLWRQALEKLEAERASLEPGQLATLRAWMRVEGCLLLLMTRDLVGAMPQASEAKRLLPACVNDPGARRLGIAAWPEWRQIAGLAR